jgi:hypothetical protein
MAEMEWTQELRKRHPWMNDDQFDCWQMFCDLMGGAHHQYGKVHDAGPRGIMISEFSLGGWSTFDSDRLTRAVFLAHERCIRFSISPCNFQNLRFHLHKRIRQEGGEFYERHPSIDQALARYTSTNRRTK